MIPIAVTLSIVTIMILILIMGLISKQMCRKQIEPLTSRLTGYQKSVSKDNLDFKTALSLFTNTIKLKFIYWYNQEILPTYLTHGPEHVTSAMLSTAADDFITDVKASLSNKIFIELLKYYFESPKAIDIFLKQYFYNEVNNRELKHGVPTSNKGALNGI